MQPHRRGEGDTSKLIIYERQPQSPSAAQSKTERPPAHTAHGTTEVLGETIPMLPRLAGRRGAAMACGAAPLWPNFAEISTFVTSCNCRIDRLSPEIVQWRSTTALLSKAI